MRKQQAILEYLRDCDKQAKNSGVNSYSTNQLKTIELMRSDVEKTQKEI
jgi:hypothetical protein